jgi:hypothetical protein
MMSPGKTTWALSRRERWKVRCGPSTPELPRKHHGNDSADNETRFSTNVPYPRLFARLLYEIARCELSQFQRITDCDTIATSSSTGATLRLSTELPRRVSLLHARPIALPNAHPASQTRSLRLPTKSHLNLGKVPPGNFQPRRHNDERHVSNVKHVQRKAQEGRPKVLCCQGRPHTRHLPQLGGLQGANRRRESGM